jgi:hypothetical protein
VFPVIYGLQFKDVISHEDLAIGTYRWSVSNLIPKMTKVAKEVKGDAVMPEKQDAAKQLFLYHVSRADYEKEWGRDYKKPGVGTRFLAWILRVMPKIGPLRGLSFHAPTAQTQDLFFKSINSTLERYREELGEVKAGKLTLENLDFDTGKPSLPGEYKLTDETYAKWVEDLADKKFADITPMVRVNILEFYADPKGSEAIKIHKHRWEKTQEALQGLKDWRPEQMKPATAGVSK